MLTITIPASLEKLVCFIAFKPDVISKIDEIIKAKSLDIKSLFRIHTDIIEKMIIYPPILKIFSNEFSMHLSRKLLCDEVEAILKLICEVLTTLNLCISL